MTDNPSDKRNSAHKRSESDDFDFSVKWERKRFLTRAPSKNFKSEASIKGAPPSDPPPPLIFDFSDVSVELRNLLQKIDEFGKKNKEKPIPPDKVAKRKKIIYEIVASELIYIKDLQIVTEYFLKPIREGQVLSLLEISQLFSNIELVVLANKELTFLLDKHTTKFAEYSAIGEIFNGLTTSLIPVYVNYCTNHQVALNTLDKLKTSKKFQKFLNEVSVEKTRGLELDAFIIMPIQRICRYPLLIKELIEATEEGSQDHASLKESYQTLTQFINTVNANSREINNIKRMKEISKDLSGAEHIKLIMPGRRFVHEGDLLVVKPNASSSSNNQIERHFILFSDMIIWCKITTKEKYHFKGMIPLLSLSYQDLPEPTGIKLGRKNTEEFYILMAKDVQTKCMWLNMLEQVTEKLNRESVLFGNVGFQLSTAHNTATKVDTNHQVQLIDIQNMIAGVRDLVDSDRRFIIDDSAFINNFIERHLFLFNDQLLICKIKSNKKYKLKLAISLKSGTVSCITLPDEHPYYNRISIIYSISTEREILIMLETPEKKQFWLEQINKLLKTGNRATTRDYASTSSAPTFPPSIGDLCNKKIASSSSNITALVSPRPLGPQRSISSSKLKRKTTVVKTILSKANEDESKPKKYLKWDPDSSTTNCTGCQSTFTTINRRHHCRNCGHIFCGACTDKKAYMRQFGTKKKVRVCSTCYDSRDGNSSRVITNL